MSLLDSIKEFFGGGLEDVQNTVAEHVNTEELGQKAEEIQQNVGDAVSGVTEEAGQKVEDVKNSFSNE